MPTLPRATWADFTYAGGFRLPRKWKMDKNGNNGNFLSSRGGIGIADENHLYVQGYVYPKLMAVAKVPIKLSKGLFEDLPVIDPSEIGEFLDIESNVEMGDNNHVKNRMTSMYIHNGYLIGSLAHNYDSNGKDQQFTWRSKNGVVEGLFSNEGAYHSLGWITDVPLEWQETLGCAHIMGGGHNYSISGRASIGPTAFGVDLDQITADVVVEPVKTTTFMDYDHKKGYSLCGTKYPELEIQHGYQNFRYNCVQVKDPAYPVDAHNRVSWPEQGPTLGNDIWIGFPRVGCGFIIPGTCTYAVIGTMYGMEHGAGYRIRNDKGVQSSGPSPYVQSDWSHYVWLFDVNDWLEVKAGTKEPHEMLPYEHHPIDIPVTNPTGLEGTRDGNRAPIKNGCVIGNRVYLSMQAADSSQPLIVAFDAALGGVVAPPIEPPVVPPIIEPPVIDPVAEATQAAHDAIDNLVTVLGK